MDSKLFEHIFRDGEHFDEHFIKHIDTYADKHPAGVVKQLATRLRKAWQDLEQAKKDAALVRAQALDEASEVCNGFIDAKEQARAALAAAKALKEGSMRDQIDRLSHEGTVNLYNRTLERCAEAIRALKG
jgi:hypothetical protein